MPFLPSQDACDALQSLCAALGPSLAPYLPRAMRTLDALIASPSSVVRVAAINVVSAAAASSQRAFEPYAAEAMNSLLHIIRSCSKAEGHVRATATSCAAAVARGCSRAVVEPFAVSLISLSVEALATSHDDDLRVASLSALSAMAGCIGSDFAAFLPLVMPEVNTSTPQASTRLNSGLSAILSPPPSICLAKSVLQGLLVPCRLDNGLG